MVYFIFNKPLFFFFWKIFISLTSTSIVFYFFLLQKDHYIFHDHIFNFFFFFFIYNFNKFFLEPVFVFFFFVDNILLTLLYIGNRTVYKKHYWSFMYFKKLTLPHKLCKFYKLCKLCESFMSSILSSSHLKSHKLL